MIGMENLSHPVIADFDDLFPSQNKYDKQNNALARTSDRCVEPVLVIALFLFHHKRWLLRRHLIGIVQHGSRRR